MRRFLYFTHFFSRLMARFFFICQWFLSFFPFLAIFRFFLFSCPIFSLDFCHVSRPFFLNFSYLNFCQLFVNFSSCPVFYPHHFFCLTSSIFRNFASFCRVFYFQFLAIVFCIFFAFSWSLETIFIWKFPPLLFKFLAPFRNFCTIIKFVFLRNCFCFILDFLGLFKIEFSAMIFFFVIFWRLMCHLKKHFSLFFLLVLRHFLPVFFILHLKKKKGFTIFLKSLSIFRLPFFKFGSNFCLKISAIFI